MSGLVDGLPVFQCTRYEDVDILVRPKCQKIGDTSDPTTLEKIKDGKFTICEFMKSGLNGNTDRPLKAVLLPDEKGRTVSTREFYTQAYHYDEMGNRF